MSSVPSIVPRLPETGMRLLVGLSVHSPQYAAAGRRRVREQVSIGWPALLHRAQRTTSQAAADVAADLEGVRRGRQCCGRRPISAVASGLTPTALPRRATSALSPPDEPPDVCLSEKGLSVVPR